MQIINEANINKLFGNKQLNEKLSNLRQGDAVILDIDSLLIDKDISTFLRYLKETGHPVILLTSHKDKTLNETVVQLTKLGVKDDIHTLVQAPGHTGEMLIEHINNSGRFKDIKRLHIVNGNSANLEDIESALSKDELCKNMARLHYHYQPQEASLTQAPPLNPVEEEIIVKGIVKTQLKKGKILDDIKHQRHPLYKGQSAEIQQGNNQAGFSQSEFHLKTIMGNDFNNEAPLATNIRIFLEDNKYKDYRDPHNAESYLEKPSFEYSATVIDKLIPQAVNMINYEKEHPEKVFFYHGASSEIAYAYTIYTALYKILAADSTVDALRADNALFHRCLNIQSFIAHFQGLSENGKINDHNSSYIEGAISTNLFLFGNHDIAGENTIRFYTDNYIVSAINLKVMLEASLKSMGVNDETINKLSKLFNEFPQRNQGVLYQIGLPKDEIDHYAYLAGVLGTQNPAPKNAGGTTAVSGLVTAMNKGEKVASNYVQNVQARVMIPPDAPITTNHYNWGQPINLNQQAAFDKQLDGLAEDMAYQILLNRNQFNKLNSKSALMRYLPNVMQQAGINIDKNNISDELVIHLVETSDFESLKPIVDAYPEYKEKPLNFTNNAYSSYAKVSNANQHQTILERCLTMRYSGEGIRAIYGDHFYEGKLNTFPFHQVVGALRDNERLEFIIKHQDKIQNSDTLAWVLGVVNKHDQLKIIEIFHDKIQNISQMVKIAIVLSEDARSDFLKKHSDKIKNSDDLVKVMNTLPEDTRLDFAMASRNKTYSIFNLMKVIQALPGDARFKFAIENTDKIHMSYELDIIMSTLPVEARFDFAMANRNKIHSVQDYLMIMKTLPEYARLDFAAANSKIDVNVGNLLANAIKANQLDTIQALLNHPKIDVNRVDNNGVLPIGLAMQNMLQTGSEFVINALLNHPNINLETLDNYKSSVDYLDDARKNYYKSQPIIHFFNMIFKELEGKNQDALLDNLSMDWRDLNEDIMYREENQHDLDAVCSRIESSLKYFKAFNLSLPNFDISKEFDNAKIEMANRQAILRGQKNLMNFSDNASKNQYMMEPLIHFLTKNITKLAESGAHHAIKNGLENCLNELKQDITKSDNILDPNNKLSKLNELVASANIRQSETLFHSVPVLDPAEFKKSMQETQRRYVSIIPTVGQGLGK